MKSFWFLVLSALCTVCFGQGIPADPFLALNPGPNPAAVASTQPAMVVTLNMVQVGPSTPVPPIPTDWQLYQVYLVQLLNLRTQIQTALADEHLYQYLLDHAPTGSDVSMLEESLYLAQFERAILEGQADMTRNLMLELNP